MKKRRLSGPVGLSLLLKKTAMIMKLNFVFIFLLSLNISANVYSQQKLISLNLRNVGMEEFIQTVKKQTGVQFLYSSALIRQAANVSVRANTEELSEVLKRVLEQAGLEYHLQNDIIVLRRKGENIQDRKTAAGRKITGKVVDGDGNPLPGVTIVIEGTQLGGATDVEGHYSLMIPDGKINLIFTFVGMKTKKVTVGDKNVIDITLETETENLGEVVVTGMFNRKKEGFTGSATKVTGEEIKRMTSGNVLRAIEMLDPGFRMNVSNIAGSNPSAIPDFEMRGQSNMGDYSSEETVIMRGDIDTRPNQPLFVLDGIIGVSVTKIIDMDPEQIESITLLKDAAAMVIYGSRASNGVVVVETKAPEKGRLRVSYNGNYKIQTPDLSVYHLLNAADKLELEKRAGFYDEAVRPAVENSGLINSYAKKLLEVKRGVNSYWLKLPVRTAFAHRHGINLEGGDNSLRYKIYFGANFSPGIMKGTAVNAKSASIDIRYRYGGLLISNQMYVDYTVSDRTSSYGSFADYGAINSYYRIYDDYGKIRQVLDDHTYQTPKGVQYVGGYSKPTLNPLYNTLYNYKDQNKSFEVRDVFSAEYNPVESLRLSADFTISKLGSDVDVFKPSNHTSFEGKPLDEKGSYDWNNTNTINYNISFTASYNKVFNNLHLLSVFARYDINERYNHYVNTNVTGFPNDLMDEVYLGVKPRTVTGNEGKSRSIGFVSTVNYSYDQRYAADFSVRVDASSEFGRNNRLAPFWSAGVRWNLHKEKWIQKTGLIDELVLRTTYGITGSQGFSPYQSLQMYTYSDMMRFYHSSDVIGTTLQSLGNPDLKWQKTDNYNIGFDFNILHRIISGRLEYYYKYTKNTLLSFSLPPSVGFTTITDNMGNISNKGYEATLRIMPYNNLQKQLNFNVVLNGSHNVNRIEQISNALRARNQESMEKVTSRPLPQYVEGYSQSIIWGVRSLGIDPVSGREVFLKRDGTMTNEWDAIDQVPLGDTEPKLQGTLSANLNWRGLTFSIAGRYRFGGQIYNYTLVDKVENANLLLNVDERAFNNRWMKPGDETLFKGVTRNANGSDTRASSRFVMDNNEFAINTINVQYRFERKYFPMLGRIGVSSAVVGMYLEDLVRLSTVKMERGINYPFSRQVSMSLNVVF